jgi:type IV pilus assembly protein PilF
MHIGRLMIAGLLVGALGAPVWANASAQERARLRTELAAGYFARGNYAIALEEIKNALANDDNYVPAYNVRGLIYAELNENALAESSFQRALRSNPADPDVNHNYGWFLCNRLGRPGDALKFFQVALRDSLYTGVQRSLIEAGVCALRAGNLELAQTMLQRASENEPDQPRVLMARAELAYRQGDFAAARALLSRHARQVPPSAESLWLNLRVERRMGQTESEAGFARELQTRFPSSPEAKLLAQGRYD